MIHLYPTIPQAERAKLVVVIGAGMSGLFAALLLQRAGHEVLVFEAQSRPGGRVLTMRDGSGAAIAEAGAGRIPTTQTWTTALIEQLGLATDPLHPDPTLHPVAFVAGKRVKLSPWVDLAAHFDLPQAERSCGLEGLIATHLQSGVRRIETTGAMHGSDWPPTSLADLDEGTVRDYLLAQGLSEPACHLLTLGAFPRKISPLILFRVLATYDSRRLRWIRGGNNLLPQTLATMLDEAVIYDAPVKAIQRDAGETRMSVDASGRAQQVAADAVICAVPFPLLSEIEITPALSTAKRRIVAEMRYTKAVKVAFKLRERFWEREGLNGFAQMDTSAEIWSPRPFEPSDTGVLQLNQEGERALAMDRMSPSDRTAHALAMVEKIFRAPAKGWWSHSSTPGNAITGHEGLMESPNPDSRFPGNTISRLPKESSISQGSIRPPNMRLGSKARSAPVIEQQLRSCQRRLVLIDIQRTARTGPAASIMILRAGSVLPHPASAAR